MKEYLGVGDNQSWGDTVLCVDTKLNLNTLLVVETFLGVDTVCHVILGIVWKGKQKCNEYKFSPDGRVIEYITEIGYEKKKRLGKLPSETRIQRVT